MRKRVLLAALATLLLATASIRLGGQQWLQDRLREPRVRRTFELEKTACLADRRSGRAVYSWTHENLAATIRELGRLRVDEVVPALALLLDNEILPEACIDALGAIADDRAIFALAARALSTEGLAGEKEAGAHLRRLAVPVYPILVRALSAPDPLLRRRAAILLGRLPSKFRMLRASEADATLFEVPPDGAAALLPRFQDASPQARFEAVRAYLSLGGDPRTARSILADESNLSIRDLLDGIPGALASPEHRNWPPRIPHDYFAVRAAAAHRAGRPPDRDYRRASDWRSFRDGLEIRVSLPESTLTLPEPQFELNRPVWIRAEIRNPGPTPRTLRAAGSDAPFVTLWLRDAYGNFEHIRRAEVEVVADRVGGIGAPEVTLAPGDVAIVELNLLRGLQQLRLNGKYGVAVSAKGAEPPLLELLVRNMPEPAWLSRNRGSLGLDPSRIYFDDVDLSLPPALPGPRDRAPVPLSSGGVDEKVASKTQAMLRRFLETQDRRLLYGLTRFLSAKELSANLQRLPVTITPSSKARPRQLTDRQATEPNDELVDLRVLRGDAASYHILVGRRFVVPVPDRLGNQRSWESQILHSTFNDGRLSEPVVVCEGCSNPASSIAPDGAVWLITAVDGGLSARRLSRDGTWSPPESILDETPRLMSGFDTAIDGEGNLWVVWGAWNGDDQPETFRLRVRYASGWHPGESLPLPLGMSARNLRVRWLNGKLGIFASVQEKPGSPSRTALFVPKEDGRLSYRKFDANGANLEAAPSGEPLLFVSHFYHPAETVELQELRAVGMTPMDVVAGLGTLMAPEGGYRGLGLAVDHDDQPLVLAGWYGHVLLLRRPEPGRTQAALLALASRSEDAGLSGSAKPPMIGNPQLFVTGDEFAAFWLETLWRMEGSQPKPRRSRLWYLSGRFSNLDWHNVTVIPIALRPTTGLLRSDLGFLGRTALSEALAADERGETLAAMERFVWLIESSRDLGGFLEPDSASVPSTWIQQRFRNGDAEVRQRLWSLAAERPLLFAPDSSLLGLLAEEIRPQESVERSKSVTRPN